MASAWVIAVSGWLLSPIIGLLLNKILSYLGFFDASQKLRELETHTLPKLKLKLREVEEQSMLQEARKEISDANTLDKLASRLKHSLYEAEDILDLRDYHRIEKKVRDGEPHNSSWLHWWVQHLDGAVGTCKRIWLGVNFTRGRAALQWAQSLLYRSSAILPVSSAPSVPSVQRLRCSCRPFDFNNCCRSIFNWVASAYEVARFYRDWSYDVVGITSYQEGGTTSDDAPLNMPKSGLKKNLEKIEKIISEAEEMLQRLNLPSHTNANRGQTATANSRVPVTTAAPPPKVFGRDKDRDNIIAMLHDGQSTSKSGLCYSVIGIHGISGSGKSTLAQLVCDREKKEKQEKKRGHFDLVMWVHVSQNFSVNTIFSEMFEEATGKPCPHFSSRDTLQENLEKELVGKRLLLVLDDVWYNKDVSRQQELQQILSPLMVGGAGSKILVTSRTADALIDLCAESIPISDLDEIVFLNLFMHHALGFAMVNDQVRSILETIGKDIAKKLKRSPLAAIAVGGQLRIRQEIEFWISVRDGDLLNETMDALWWSYQHFDEQVRRCFAYCSIFPRRHHLDRDELVNQWVAEGFIKTTETGKEMEDIARGYLDELVSTSFLLLGGKNHWGRNYYTVHDLLHDLAEKVAGRDCFRIENGWTGKVPPDIRHLFFTTCNRIFVTQDISELENLRTLIIDNYAMDETEFESIFTRLRKLRTLKVQMGPRQFVVPASIGQLKHLRYLSIRTRFLPKLILPSTLSKLYHMQVLDLGFGGELVGPDLSKFINLRRLLTSRDEPISPNIGGLMSLQTLQCFWVKKEPGYELRQLKHLDKLRGMLKIKGLGNVGSKEEALEANLAGKKHLTNLELAWDGADGLWSCSADLQAEILEGLCPPMNLQTLRLRGYEGSRYPDWMVGNKNGPKHLQLLTLLECSRLGAIPCRNGFFVHLRGLALFGCSWDSLPDNMQHLTLLKKLCIYYCRNIRSLPTLPQSLEELDLNGCSLTSLSDNMEHLTSLKKLSIYYCKDIRSLPTLPQSLEKFELKDCSLKSLPDNMEHLTSLKELFIYDCNNIRSLPTLPQSLEKFELKGCSLKSLPDNTEHLTLLKELSIQYTHHSLSTRC